MWSTTKNLQKNFRILCPEPCNLSLHQRLATCSTFSRDSGLRGSLPLMATNNLPGCETAGPGLPNNNEVQLPSTKHSNDHETLQSYTFLHFFATYLKTRTLTAIFCCCCFGGRNCIVIKFIISSYGKLLACRSCGKN